MVKSRSFHAHLWISHTFGGGSADRMFSLCREDFLFDRRRSFFHTQSAAWMYFFQAHYFGSTCQSHVTRYFGELWLQNSTHCMGFTSRVMTLVSQKFWSKGNSPIPVPHFAMLKSSNDQPATEINCEFGSDSSITLKPLQLQIS